WIFKSGYRLKTQPVVRNRLRRVGACCQPIVFRPHFVNANKNTVGLVDSYAQHLRTFRFWDRLGIVTVVALLPVVAFGAFMAQRFSDVHALPLLLGAMWLVALGNALYRIRTFRCPRCEKTFSVHGWWMPNTRGRKCVHCALDLDGEVQPAGAPVVKSINLAEKLATC